jgi:putative membrane-bound dehydrogenase-like protein
MVKVGYRGLALLAVLLSQAAPRQSGPESEKRFPPLLVPSGFKVTLFACDPLIEYPSVLSIGPRPGSVFLAHDYMTGLGTKIERQDEIRLVEDTDGDGYADKSTLYAGGFNSIQGLAFHAGTVWAMHAPFLTALRDTDGDGVADERKDLLRGLGWPPEKAPDRLHCANGVVPAHDGWLYLALGDRGCDVERPEGDRLVLNGGGILRCRPDGRDLHVFATGLRNIYDLALDEALNVFTRDNENDGGAYKIRVCHSFFGADHGYPYLYEERPEEALAPLADLGLGSSAGVACYLEQAFPAEYRGNLISCEWGRSVVRSRLEPAGSGFGPVKEIEFAAGAAADPYGFKPTDLVVDRDGSLLVSDWCDGQRPRRGRGRVYRISAGAQKPAAGLDSESYHVRVAAQESAAVPDLRKTLAAGRLGALGRMHAVWAIARSTEPDRLEVLLGLVKSDPDPRVRVQAVRAVADLADPVLVHHRLEAPRGDAEVAERLGMLTLREQDPRVLREICIALGRLRWSGAAEKFMVDPSALDPAFAHAIAWTLRRSGDWGAILALPNRSLALRAIAGQAEPGLADILMGLVDQEKDPARRREYADLLARVHRKPGPWVYWGFRPGPRPANTEAWERTEAIGWALNRLLADPDRAVRLSTLRRMQREKVPVLLEALVNWLRFGERDPECVAAILESLRERPAAEVRELAEGIVRDDRHAPPNRLAALDLEVRGLDPASEGRLLDLARGLDDSPVLAEALRQLGKRPRLEGRTLLAGKLVSSHAEVRAAAAGALADLGARDAGEAVARLLGDPEVRVRQAAAGAVGRLGFRGAADALLALTRDGDALLRRRSLEALGRLKEPRAVPAALPALADPEMELAALEVLSELGGLEQADAVAAAAARSRSAELLGAAIRALSKWGAGKAVAAVQGESGLLLRWSLRGPSPAGGAPPEVGPEGREAIASGPDGVLAFAGKAEGEAAWLAAADWTAAEAGKAQFFASAGGGLRVWLNGRAVHARAAAAPFAPDSDRFEGDLVAGANRLVLEVTSSRPPQFHVRFRRKSPTERHERLTQMALASGGSARRGREVFQNAEKSACLKCHRLGEQGARIGPELTGVGRRFSRIHLVESILEPSRTIATGFQNMAVRLKDGRVISGVRVGETETTLSLGDAQGQVHALPKSEIDAQRALALSVMPEGLEKGLTDQEFADLVAFLVDQK